MKRFALSLVLILAATTLVFAAAKTDENQTSQASSVAAGQNVQAKTSVRSLDVKDGAKDSAKEGVKEGPKTGDIIIKGKAGSVPSVETAQGVKPETSAGSVKARGQ